MCYKMSQNSAAANGLHAGVVCIHCLTIKRYPRASSRLSLRQSFSDGLAKLCDERFKALLAEPRGNELLDPYLSTVRPGLGSPAAPQGKAELATISADASAEGVKVLDIGWARKIRLQVFAPYHFLHDLWYAGAAESSAVPPLRATILLCGGRIAQRRELPFLCLES